MCANGYVIAPQLSANLDDAREQLTGDRLVLAKQSNLALAAGGKSIIENPMFASRQSTLSHASVVAN